MNDYFIYYGLTYFAIFITSVAQIFVTSTYRKYLRFSNEKGISGKEAARILLDKNGLEDVDVLEVNGFLSDHYDPTSKRVFLSNDVYNGKTVASVSVACHECGHAIQDKDDYVFMRIRAGLVPVVNFSSYAGYFAILLGVIFGSFNLIWLGILAEIVILLFQIVTLPVEIDASRRALKELNYTNLLNDDELHEGKIMLIAAALTYVASVASAIIEVLRLVLMFGRRDDKD